MPKGSLGFVLFSSYLALASAPAVSFAQQIPFFNPGNLVVMAEGCGTTNQTAVVSRHVRSPLAST